MEETIMGPLKFAPEERSLALDESLQFLNTNQHVRERYMEKSFRNLWGLA